MRKLLSLALILTSFAPGVSSAGFESEHLKIGLTGRFRWENASQYNLVDQKQFSSIRLRTNFTFTGIENVKIFVEPQFNKVLGAPTYVPSATGTNSPSETSGNSGYGGGIDSVSFRNAFFDFSLSDKFNFIAGRQVLVYGDSLIMGASDWGVYGRSFDALRLKYDDKTTSVDLFQAKVVEHQTSTTTKGRDKDYYGLYASVKASETIKAIDVYGFYLQDRQSDSADVVDATRPWHFGTYGTRLVAEFYSFQWKFEAAKNFGSENSSYISAKDEHNGMFDTRITYSFSDRFNQKLALQVYRAGENWRDLYPTTSEAFGFVDVIGRRNTTGGAIHWNASWTEKWGTDFSVFYFQRTSTDSRAYQPDSRTAIGNTLSKSRDIGSETDLKVKHFVNKNVTVTAGANVFFIGTYLKDTLERTITPSYGYFMIETKY